jgi:hypothetical protein
VSRLFVEKSPASLLQDIRKEFVDHRATRQGRPLHWGQFLDVAVAAQQVQVGLYGGVAACLAFAADGRVRDRSAVDARTDLLTYWNERNDPDPDKAEYENNLRQNARLTFLLLALAFGYSFTEREVVEVWDLLKGRRLPSDGLWSDSAGGTQQHPSEYSSSVILILLSVVRQTSTGSPHDFNELDAIRLDAGKKLQTAYLGNRKKVRQYKLVVLIAIMLCLQKKADSKVKSELNEIALKNIDIAQRYTHFYDYQKQDNTQSRDYLILPVNLLGAFLLYGQGLPARHYFYATRVLEAMATSLEKSPNSLFMEGERPSSLEQGIVVMALQGWIQQNGGGKWRLWWPKIWWHLWKSREFNRWTAFAFLVPLYGPVAIAATGETLTEFLVSQGAFLWLVPVIASLQLPKWGLAVLAVVAGVIAKPQDLVRVFLGKKK